MPATLPEPLRRQALLELAVRCETEEASVALNVRIFLALNDPDILVIDDHLARFPRPSSYVKARSIWNDEWPLWGDKGQVEATARELGCRDYTGSLDAARTLSNWLLLHASDIAADGAAYVVLCDPGPTPPREVKGLGGRTLELTYCAAALRARAEEIDDG